MKENNDLIYITNHIELVSNNIDIIINNITKNNSYNEDINNITLLDLIQIFANNDMLPSHDVLASINNNTYRNASYVKNSDFIKFFINELEIRKKFHDNDLLEKLNNEETISEQLNKHHKNNRHHPEYFSLGIRGMNIGDLTEMFCDWYATCKCNGEDIYKLIEINQEKYKYGKVLTRVLENTVNKYFDK